MQPADRYPLALLCAFAAIWAALAVAPWYRQDWLLENAIVFVAVGLFVKTFRSLRFSNFAYTCLFVFLVLHEIGSHYTYSLVPYARALQALDPGLVGCVDASGNHYDRGRIIIMPILRRFSMKLVCRHPR